jgi:hypothetical protein
LAAPPTGLALNDPIECRNDLLGAHALSFFLGLRLSRFLQTLRPAHHEVGRRIRLWPALRVSIDVGQQRRKDADRELQPISQRRLERPERLPLNQLALADPPFEVGDGASEDGREAELVSSAPVALEFPERLSMSSGENPLSRCETENSLSSTVAG